MKIVFTNYDDIRILTRDYFTINKIYDVKIIYFGDDVCVIDDNECSNTVLKNEYVELEEYKKQLVKERFEQK